MGQSEAPLSVLAHWGVLAQGWVSLGRGQVYILLEWNKEVI